MKDKLVLFLFALLATASAHGAGDVTVKLDSVSPKGNRPNIWFECRLTIHNGTSTPLTTSNLFYGRPGLALMISDTEGKELNRIYADPYKNYLLNSPTIPPGNTTFSEPYGLGRVVSLPAGVQTVRVRLEGTLPGSRYTNFLTSNTVDVNVP